MSWHADEELLQQYASGGLDAANSFSVEAHILACDDCRIRVPRDATRLDAIWSGVRGSISAPAKLPCFRGLVWRKAKLPLRCPCAPRDFAERPL